MRNPNGYGGINFLGKNRRNPYRVRITTGWEYDNNTGKTKQKYATLGYYPTRKEAIMALADYNKSPYDIDKTNVTFEELYKKWANENYPLLKKSNLRSHKSAFALCEPLYNLKIRDVKKDPMQNLLNDLGSKYSKPVLDKIKAIFRIVFNTAIENDVIDKDYSQFVKVNNYVAAKEIHTAFSADEINMLWDNLNFEVDYDGVMHKPVDTILIMCYTGMRPGELLDIRNDNIHIDEKYMIGGLKTEAGKNRAIPIHNDILPLIEKRYNPNSERLIELLNETGPYNQYRKYFFDPVMEFLKIKHLPHDGRHTFASFADRSQANPLSIKRIIGHKSQDFTKDVYTHKTIEELVEAVNMIHFRK